MPKEMAGIAKIQIMGSVRVRSVYCALPTYVLCIHVIERNKRFPFD